MTAGLLDALEHAIALATERAEIREFEILRDAHDQATELLTAAHASLTARDLADQLAADDRLRAALAACEPTDTDHNREAVDGLCVEENDDEQ
ncbi:MAG TPA: hypothetical protein DCP40_00540 [Stenotrophomonas sp.]|nr:hypothetical protein [Stenotrophomonas sp.]